MIVKKYEKKSKKRELVNYYSIYVIRITIMINYFIHFNAMIFYLTTWSRRHTNLITQLY